MSSILLLILSAVSWLAILCLSLVKKLQFWPPPDKHTWPHRTMKLLFRGFLYPLVALTWIEFEPLTGLRAVVQYGVGGILLFVGFGLAIVITLNMGWRNAFGEKRGLKTTGWFSWSRNPIYVVTWIGLIGWGLIANNFMVAALLTGWAIMYLLAPLKEEPWLEEQYGNAYRQYKRSVRRFL